MNLKITNKSLFSTIFILILVIIILIVGYTFINKNYNDNYIDKFSNILGEPIFNETLNETFNETFNETVNETVNETCAKKLICGEICNIVKLPKDYKFDNDETVRNHIEDFFRLYISIVDIGCINDKIKTYINPDLTMGKIFKEKQLSLSDFSNLTYKLIDNLYFSNMSSINKSYYNNYGAFKLVKQKLENLKLSNYNYNLYYDNNYYMYMLNKNITDEQLLDKIKPKVEEIYEKNGDIFTTRNVDLNEIINTNKCVNDVCKISIKTLIGQDMIEKLGGFSSFNNKVGELRDDLTKNFNIMKTLCETSIVIDLMLKYYNITNLNDLVTLFKNKNIDINKYNELHQIILTNVNNLSSKYFPKVDFLKYVSLDNI